MKLANALSTLALAAAFVFSAAAHAQVSSDLENLGSNRDVKKRASSIESRSRVSVVQNRAVKRDWRFELGVNYGANAAGDTYLNTRNVGAQIDLHVTPRFSLGVRYSKAGNDLTPAGKQAFDNARMAKAEGRTEYTIPDIDYPDETVMGVINWYMLYGKINFFDFSVVQFDIYSLAGGGQMQLSSGPTGTWTAGGGIGFWLNQHVTSRFELRYQNYSDQLYTGTRQLDLIVGTFGVGVLL